MDVKAGDLVVLKSGGVMLTVTGAYEDRIEVAWSDGRHPPIHLSARRAPEGGAQRAGAVPVATPDLTHRGKARWRDSHRSRAGTACRDMPQHARARGCGERAALLHRRQFKPPLSEPPACASTDNEGAPSMHQPEAAD